MVEDAGAHRRGERRERVHLCEESAGARTLFGHETEGLRDVVVHEEPKRDARVESPPRAPQVLAGDLAEVERPGERLAECEDRADLGVPYRALGVRTLERGREAMEDRSGDQADAEPQDERGDLDRADYSARVGDAHP